MSGDLDYAYIAAELGRHELSLQRVSLSGQPLGRAQRCRAARIGDESNNDREDNEP
jgi:hypothetical protein